MASRTARREFERLVREHHAAVYRSASRVVSDPQAAEDVTQRVFLALLEGRLELSGGQEERAVLRWWAVRGALAHLRGERHRRTREEGREMPMRDEDPAEQAVQRDERSTLKRLIGALPEDLRLALRLRFEEGLTFARMATALEVSEPTAHARVQRALETLRVRVRGCGLAAFALDLEPRLSDVSQAALPPGLPERLLALQATATSSAALLPIVAAAAVLTVGAGAWAIAKKPRQVPEPVATVLSDLPAPAAMPPAGLESEPERTAVSSTQAPDIAAPAPVPAAAQAAHGWVVGHVVDADGVPVSGARVTAATVERAGKLAREARQTTTRDDGGFELELPVLSPDGTSWSLSALAAGLRARSSGSLRVDAGDRENVGVLQLGGRSQSRPGPWSLALRVVAPDGRPVAGAVVQVLQRVVDARGSEVDGPMEARGVSDPGGWLVLEGDLLGRKRVHVEARPQGWSPLALELPLEGAQTEVVVLEPGLQIRGVLVDASGRPVEPIRDGWASDPQVYASARDPNAWIQAAHEPGGRFLIRGLAPEPHRVFLQSQSHSPICLEGVLPGENELEIVVKRRDEPLDVGPHCPEVHGFLRDARTGELVQADWDDVEMEWLPDAAGLDFERDVMPNVLWPRPRQTALFGELPKPRADFHLVGLSPGRQAVAARVHGYAPVLSSPIVLAPGALVADLELGLERPARLEGAVLDVDGTPLADAWVVLTGNGPHSRGVIDGLDRDVRETDGRPAAWSRNLARTDESGRFVFEGVPPGLVCTLVALHPRRVPVHRAECRPGGACELRFIAPRVR